MKAAALALAALLGGCAGAPHITDVNPTRRSAELESTPFFPQDEYQCGPAALATVLSASGVAVTAEELVERIYLPGRKGSLQAELVSTSRAYGRVPYALAPSFGDLLAEVAAGNAVLILQNLGLPFWPAWHYAVVVGYDEDRDELVLRSGRERRRIESTKAFLRHWNLAERWALVVVPPDSPPQTARALDWLRTAGAFEELGKFELAAQAYRASTRRWPDDPLGWQLLGNARYAQRDWIEAESAFRSALRIEPSASTRNNLATVLLERGCPMLAAAEIQRALERAAPEAETRIFKRTREQIESYRGPVSADCQ